MAITQFFITNGNKERKDAPAEVFHNGYHNVYLWQKFGDVLESAGLPTDSKSKFHRIRKSVATHYTAAGGDATAALGHSSAQVTKDSYLDPRYIPSAAPCDVLPTPAATVQPVKPVPTILPRKARPAVRVVRREKGGTP